MDASRFAAVIVVAVVAFVLVRLFVIERRRDRAFVEAASLLGFTPVPDPETIGMYMTPLLEERGGEIRNAMQGSWNGLSAFLFDFNVHRGRASYRQTVAAFVKNGLNMPMFQIRPKTLGDRLAGFIHRDSVPLEGFPEFQRQYTVHSVMKDEARAFIANGIAQYIESLPQLSYSVEGATDTLAVYALGKRQNPSTLDEFLRSTGDIASGVLNQVRPAIDAASE